jgi:NAD(P)-dependent dehydrogenase (short-subunit alcohol dehydrogenase family)
MSKIVLITGCSTGIGCDLAQHLTQSGYTVVATARNVAALEGSPAALKLPLDVTSPESIQQAVDATLQQYGCIDVLVNNAGYACYGAVEEISDEQLQMMFDVNVFGAMRMVRAVVPPMRRQRAGRIINISSITGKLVTPVNGAYSATKFALEALSDALCLELEPFGIQVVLVEPGSIHTGFTDRATALNQETLANPASPYRALYRQHEQVAASMRRGNPGPEVVSGVVQQAIQVAHPKARYLAGAPFSVKLVIQLGDSVWDLVVRKMFKIAPQLKNRRYDWMNHE